MFLTPKSLALEKIWDNDDGVLKTTLWFQRYEWFEIKNPSSRD